MGTQCRSCGAAIVWAETAAGKKVPLDEKPLLVFQVDAQGKAHTFKAHQNHFVTCPNAEQHRKAKPALDAVPPNDAPSKVAAHTVTTNQLVLSLGSRLCPACGGDKAEGHTFCGRDYGRLDPGVQNRLYRKVGNGYEPAVGEAMRVLGLEWFNLPAGVEAARRRAEGAKPGSAGQAMLLGGEMAGA